MPKNKANYFPHDSNARNSDKLIRLRMRHKSAGYGVYFMILERLREEPNYMSAKDYNMIAFDLREDASLIKSVVEDFGLFVFTEDGKYFYSESFNKRMAVKDEIRDKRSEAGRAAMKKRWENRGNITNDTKTDNKAITQLHDSDNKESKEKESKEDNITSLFPPIIPPLGIDPDYGDEILPMEKLKSEIPVSQSIWLEQIAMLRHLTPNALNAKLDEFFDYLTVRGKTELSVKNFKNYFGNWLDKGLKNKKEEDNGTITW